MFKYGFSEKEMAAEKEYLREKFNLDPEEEIPDEAVLINWDPEPTPSEIEKAKQLAERMQDI